MVVASTVLPGVESAIGEGRESIKTLIEDAGEPADADADGRDGAAAAAAGAELDIQKKECKFGKMSTRPASARRK